MQASIQQRHRWRRPCPGACCPWLRLRQWQSQPPRRVWDSSRWNLKPFWPLIARIVQYKLCIYEAKVKRLFSEHKEEARGWSGRKTKKRKTNRNALGSWLSFICRSYTPRKTTKLLCWRGSSHKPMLGVRKMLSITVNLPIVSSSGADHHRTWPDYRPANFEGAILKKRLIPEQTRKVFFRCGKEDWHDLRPNYWKIFKHWHNIMILWSVKALRRRRLASPLGWIRTIG